MRTDMASEKDPEEDPGIDPEEREMIQTKLALEGVEVFQVPERAKPRTGEKAHQRSAIRALRTLSEWGLAETDAWTLGELMEILRASREENHAWDEVNAIPLTDLAGPLRSPQEIMEEWAQDLNRIERQIFWERMAAQNRASLQQLGDTNGVSRGRVRQTQVKLRRKLLRFMESPDALPIRWRLETIQQTVGVAMNEEHADQILDLGRDTNPCKEIFLELAGPYERQHGWLVLQGISQGDPTQEILENADDVGRLNERYMSHRLDAWGLEQDRHRDWMVRDGRVREWNNKLVVWGKNIQDRVVFALKEMKRPGTLEEITEFIDEQHLTKNTIYRDHRLMRTGAKKWGLRTWRLPEYTGIANNMREILSKRGQMTVDEIVESMAQHFEVQENSTRMCTHAPMFVVEGDTVRIRGEEDPSYQPNAAGPLETQGTFRLGERRASKVVKVGRNLHRGSGLAMGVEMAGILEVDVNEVGVVTTEHGEELFITYPSSSVNGINLGSVKAIVKRLEAKDGDMLTLVFDMDQKRMETTITRRQDIIPSWECVGRLIGTQQTPDHQALARAMMCQGWEVPGLLEERNDKEIIRAIPEPEPARA